MTIHLMALRLLSKHCKKTFKRRLHLIKREGKLGLGTAYVRGFKFAIEHGYDFVMEMDADLSHDPFMIPHFLVAIKDADLVIGSRYLGDVANVVNWPLFASYALQRCKPFTRGSLQACLCKTLPAGSNVFVDKS